MFTCALCDYETTARTALYNHKKSKKHMSKILANNLLKDEQIIVEKEKKIKELCEKVKDLENERDLLLKYIDLLTKNKDNEQIKLNIRRKNYKHKEMIPATIKNTLWQNYFGKNIDGKCTCCKVENISIKNFDCGHIISEKMVER